jgi:hypothetical protein
LNPVHFHGANSFDRHHDFTAVAVQQINPC